MFVTTSAGSSPSTRIGVAAWVTILGVFGCGGDDASVDGSPSDAAADVAPDAAPADAASDARLSGTVTIGPSDRPARLVIPPAHDGTTPLPLVFLLHGLGVSSGLQDLLFGFTSEARGRGFYLVLPEGTTDSSGRQFWNATPECCDLDGTGVDDEGYLRALTDEVVADYVVDQERIYFTGHSNGGFMSYRMACRMSDRVAGILSVAGSGFLNEAACMETEEVSVLQIHGDADDTVSYLAGAAIVDRWVARDGCDASAAVDLSPIDLDDSVAGAETARVHYEAGCTGGAQVDLWTIQGGGHIPALNDVFRAEGLDWLLAQRR